MTPGDLASADLSPLGVFDAALFGAEGGPGLLFWALGLFLGAVRAAAAFAIAPLFSYLGLRGVMRMAIAGALALPAALGLPEALAADPPDVLTLMALIAKEAIVGFALGLVIGLPFWAAEMAGAAIDQQRMAVSAMATMPDQRTETTVLGVFFGLLYTAYVFATDAHLDILRVLYGSYTLWPALSALPATALDVAPLVGFLQELFALALLLAAPIVLLLLLSDVGVAALARFAPQMNAMMLAMQVKSLVISVAAFLYLGFLFTAFGDQLGYFVDLRALLLGAAGP